jgi:histidinol-phosphate aminotransferase
MMGPSKPPIGLGPGQRLGGAVAGVEEEQTMAPSVRRFIDDLPTYRAGRAAGAPAGAPAQRPVKLSSNESPFEPPAQVVAAVVDSVGRVNRYPDLAQQALLQALAERHRVDPERVVVGCGSMELLYGVVRLVAEPRDEVVFPWPSFGAYPRAALLAEARPLQAPLHDHVVDLKALRRALTARTRVVFVCNPNNPTGTALPGAQVRRFLDDVDEDVLVVLDDAYHEFVNDPAVCDAVELARGRENVVVLRTFSKACGLAGLRVGFGIAPPRLAEGLRRLLLTFSVSSLSQAAALASLQPEVERLRVDRIRRIVAERSRVTDRLRALGVAVPPSQGNFVFLPLGDASAPLLAACEERGISVRPVPDGGLRVTIGLPEENDAFLDVAAQVLPGLGSARC